MALCLALYIKQVSNCLGKLKFYKLCLSYLCLVSRIFFFMSASRRSIIAVSWAFLRIAWKRDLETGFKPKKIRQDIFAFLSCPHTDNIFTTDLVTQQQINQHVLWFTRDSFDRSSPNLASTAKRLLSASRAFSSAGTNAQKHPHIRDNHREGMHSKLKRKNVVSLNQTHQSLQDGQPSSLPAQRVFWNELMSIYKPC